MNEIQEHFSGDAAANRIANKILEQLNEVSDTGIRLKNLIDTAKTDLKKQYYRKKLQKNSLRAEKLIKALMMTQSQAQATQASATNE